MILAGIDVGTNTLRLLIADIQRSSFREIHSDRKITRLGQRLATRGYLSPESQQLSITCLDDFSRTIGKYAVSGVAAVGTSALRKASNSAEFIQEVKNKTGIDIRIIEGTEEAALTLLGVIRGLQGNKGLRDTELSPTMVLDIGGGSTEIILTGSEGPKAFSLPLGAVYLTERFIKDDPPSQRELERLRQAIRSEIEKQEFVSAGTTQLLGTAGTITTLVAMDLKLAEYKPELVNGAKLTKGAVDEIVAKLCTVPLAQRRQIPGLEAGREDIILAGAVVAQEIMERYSFQTMLVSDWGLREGIVIDLYLKLTPGNRVIEW